MHGYTAAWILPEGVTSEGMEIKEQPRQKYVAIKASAINQELCFEQECLRQGSLCFSVYQEGCGHH